MRILLVWSFFIAIIGTQIFAMFISIYGIIAPAAIGWGWGVSVMVISTLYMMVMDQVKVWVYKQWNFELTAKLWPSKERTGKLHARQNQKEVDMRVKRNVAKLRTVVHAMVWAKTCNSFTPLPEPVMAMEEHKHH